MIGGAAGFATKPSLKPSDLPQPSAELHRLVPFWTVISRSRGRPIVERGSYVAHARERDRRGAHYSCIYMHSAALLDPESDAAGQISKPRLPFAFGFCFMLLAGSLSLPMTADMQLIYRELSLSTETASAYFLATFLPSFLTPVFGFATDRGGPCVRYWTIIISLLLKACAMCGFALGLVTDLGRLYLFGILIALAHSIALATLDGALCARGGDASGDTSVARSRQAAKLAWQTLGDLLAALLSLVLAGTNASITLVYAIATLVNAVSALAAWYLPRAEPKQRGTQQEAGGDNKPSEHTVCHSSTRAEHPSNPSDLSGGDGAAAAPAAAAAATIAPPARGPSSARTAATAVLAAALAAFVYNLPPTPGVATGSYVGRVNATEPWVLSAQQISGFAGGFGGIGFVSQLDLPLARALPFGALAIAGSQLTSLAAYGLGGNSGTDRLDGSAWHVALLLVEPAVSNALRLCGVVPVLSLCAAAAEGSGEGGAYGLVAAADAAGALVAGSLSVVLVHALQVGNPSGTDGEGGEPSWSQLPLFVVLCSLCKIAAVPCVLLLLTLRRRVQGASQRAVLVAGSSHHGLR